MHGRNRRGQRQSRIGRQRLRPGNARRRRRQPERRRRVDWNDRIRGSRGRTRADPGWRPDHLALRAADARAVGEQRSRSAAAARGAGAVRDVHRRSAERHLLQQRAPAVHDVGVVVRLRDRRRDAVPAGGARRDRAVEGHRRHHGRRDVHPQLRAARLSARPDRRRGDDVRHAVLVGRDHLRERQRLRGRRAARHRDDAAVALLHLPDGVRGGRTAADRLRGRVEAVLRCCATPCPTTRCSTPPRRAA